MLENGFIKLHRKILKWEWYDDRNTTAVFIHLLLTVNTADELNLTIKEIRTCLQHLEQTGETAHVSTRNYTVFTVINYDSYQSRGTAKGTQNGTHTGRRGANEGQQRKKEKESQEDKEESATTSGVKTPLSAPREKSIYERMRE